MTDTDANPSSYPVSVARVKKLFPAVTWHPSRETWERARLLYADVDLMRVVVEYITKNRGNRSGPDENQWLSWVAQAQKQFDETRMRIQAEMSAREKPKRWYDVAD